LHLKLFECLKMQPDGDLKGTPASVYIRVSCQGIRKDRSEVLIETFIRKQLRLKAHTVSRVDEADDGMRVYLDRLGSRLLRCGVCGKRCREVHDIRKQREWRDLSMRKLPLKLLTVRAGWNVRAVGCGWRSFRGPSRGRE